ASGPSTSAVGKSTYCNSLAPCNMPVICIASPPRVLTHRFPTLHGRENDRLGNGGVDHLRGGSPEPTPFVDIRHESRFRASINVIIDVENIYSIPLMIQMQKFLFLFILSY
ncbi:hypothetical protein, partial [Plasticicumulans lactativorans]|uniref:hypothetical protein n=1 Tax=Plasticicumulans lactativorans TaxID=1133106 RepID=UPI001A9DF646